MLPDKKDCCTSAAVSVSAFLIDGSAAMVAEAVAAVNRTIILRLEGDLSLLAAISANNSEELTLCNAIALATTLITAVTAANGLILEALLLVECLLTSGENKVVATIFAF